MREGAPPNDGPIGGLPGPSAETDRDAPTGLPDDAQEPPPLGTDERAPDGDGEPPRGEEAMPGIPTGGEPPTAG
ncbi:MAG: hypothetical protein JWM73_241 [Solirubrobacterales bacterium]|nr:hypothetical protein [Solirubrobacterales bacterium]